MTEEPYVFKMTWEQLAKRDHEVANYSIKAWYTVPRAHSIGYFESAPPVSDPVIAVTFRMCELANSGPFYAHKSLDELWEDARALLEFDEPSAIRTRRLEGQAASHPEFAEAYKRGMADVFDLAKLTQAERIVIGGTFQGKDQSQIALATGKAIGTVKVLRSRALDKLRRLVGAELDVEEAA